MGTRAVIRFGSTRIATHWDGNPEAIGKDLEAIGNNPTLQQIVNVAKNHVIDFATKDVRDLTSGERFEAIAKKTNGKYTAQQLKDLYEKEHKMVTFGIQGAEDYPIMAFNGYNDFAEYEYDVKPNRVLYRELSGEYTPNSSRMETAIPNYPILRGM